MNHVYALSEVVGTSDKSIEDAAFALRSEKAEFPHFFLVLGKIREVKEVTERPHDAHTIVAP